MDPDAPVAAPPEGRWRIKVPALPHATRRTLHPAVLMEARGEEGEN
jgi:hypothetical protein